MGRVYDFIANTDDGAFAVDRVQTIEMWNRSAARLLGYQPREVLGRKCYAVLECRDARDGTVCDRRCETLRAGASQRYMPTRDVSVRTRAGRRIWLNMSTILVLGARGKLTTVIHLFREVSRQHDLLQIAEQFADRIADADRRQALRTKAPAHVNLTPREREVLEQLKTGASSEMIAERLSIAPRTVRNHVSNILGKLGVHSRLEAVAYSIRNGLEP